MVLIGLSNGQRVCQPRNTGESKERASDEHRSQATEPSDLVGLTSHCESEVSAERERVHPTREQRVGGILPKQCRRPD